MGKNIMNQLPNFMIIGGMRCGTTVLYKILKKHPEISFSKTKEPHFFDLDKRYLKGVKFYKEYFNIASQAIGEATASYLRRYNKVPKRIKQILPKLKVIIMLRNPVDRSFSHYFFHQQFKKKIKQKQCIYDSIEDMIAKTGFDSNVFKDSLYYFQLQEWFKYFPKSQVLIVKSEDFFKSPQLTIRKILKFLKVKVLNLNLEVDKINTITKNRKLKKHTRKIMKNYFTKFNTKLHSLINRDLRWE